MRWSEALSIAILAALTAGVPGGVLAAPAPGISPTARAKIGPEVQQALKAGLPSLGLPIIVTLSAEGLPTQGGRGPDFVAALRARQQGVLGALPPGTFQAKHRYEHVRAVAGWARRGAIEALAAHGDVERVYHDGRVMRTLAQGTALIGANAANAQGYTGDGVTVAVIDSGIDATHADLQDDLVAEQCFCDDHPAPNKGCCPDGGGTQTGPGAAAETDGHGTSVSGIVSSGGVVAAPGVAPDAGVAAIRVFGNNGGGLFSDIAAALDWVLDQHLTLGIRVVNMSLSDGVERTNPAAMPCTGSATADAISALTAAGVAVFVSSGNDGFDLGIGFPACVPEAISVGGVYDANVGPASWCGNASCSVILCTDNPTSADAFVCHSNSGVDLDLLAPNWRTNTSADGGGTVDFGGTSAACPYAAGSAAVLFEADPSLTPTDVRTLMRDHGPLVINADNGLSFRRTDLASALATLTTPVDTDGDGLSDDDEQNVHGTDPLLADTDGDGLDDGAEVNVHGTDPLDPDSDDDFADDGAEVFAGSDPNDASSVPWEVPALSTLSRVLVALLLVAFGWRFARSPRQFSK